MGLGQVRQTCKDAEIVIIADSLPEAFANACAALDLFLESLQKLGQQAPESIILRNGS
jgi:predicted RNase H-like HicB family nuclease